MPFAQNRQEPTRCLKLGQVVATPGALEAHDEAHQSPQEFLEWHQLAEFGQWVKESSFCCERCRKDILVNHKVVREDD